MALIDRPLQLIEPLGTGDLATVYRATDPTDADRPLAVAILHADLVDLDGVVASLAARVEAMRDVVHPGALVQEGIYRVSDGPALVLELVPGVDLIRLAKVGQVPAGIATAIIRDASQTLAAVQEAGLVHGFLSPRRALLTVGGRVKLAALGASVGTTLDADPLNESDRGRGRYTAPERLTGALDSPGDVYALGAMLSLLLTSTWPDRPAEDAEGQVAVAEDTARRVREEIEADTDAVAALIATCMAPNPEARPTLWDLAQALSAAAADRAAVSAWAADVVPGLAGAWLDGIESLESRESELSDNPDEIEAGPEILGALGPPTVNDPKEVMAMSRIGIEALQPIGPDDETDLANEETDEPKEADVQETVFAEEADKWDRMLGLDVVPGKAAEAPPPDQVAQRTHTGLWAVLGLVLGVGIAWSLGLLAPLGFAPGGSLDAPAVQTGVQVAPVPAAAEPLDLPVAQEPAPAPPPALVVEEGSSVVPEPVPIPVAPPAPVEAAPEARPVEALERAPEEGAVPPSMETPVPPVKPQTGLIRVAGNAHQVRLVHGGRRYSGGRMPPGAYHVEVVFRSGEPARVAARVDLSAGDKRLIRCDATFYRCTVH